MEKLTELKEIIKYTGENESFATLDLWLNGKFITELRSYNFELEIVEIDVFVEKYFRVSVLLNGVNYLFGINCDEITITEYICDDAGEILEKKERALKVE